MTKFFKLGGVATLGLTASFAQAELIYGITTGALFSFDSSTPGTIATVGGFTGVLAGQTVKGIDFRPADGQLFAFASNGTAGQLYTVNLATAAFTPVGTGFTYDGANRVSLDFNPVVDRIRLVTGSNQNLRINPATGAIAATDTDLAYAGTDSNANSTPFVAGIAYTNNVVGATSTTLYAYDFGLDLIATIGSVGGTPTSPNAGTMFTVGASGVLTSAASLGFDISGASGVAYANLDSGASTIDRLFTVNLATGAATLVGTFNADVLDISVPTSPVPEPATLAVLGLGALAMRRRRKA